ncbi:MAG: hypothetical protein P4M15_10925 [Alphaproteobacteria bacterium]|nr:hypothetical protein [Alphaproteobacteria bacterium]
MHFERYSQPILPRPKWWRRVAKSLVMALTFVVSALLVGILGYHFLGGLGWIDAFLEAAMILGGMGAVASMTNDAVKIFAGCYALFSGLVVISVTGLLLAPWLHRMLHYSNYEPKK